MAHIHREPYITLAGVTAERALIAWGAFFFEVSGDAVDGRFKLIEDKDLTHVNPPRSTSIGERSSDFGPAEIRVWEKGSDPAHPITVVVPSDSPATRVNHAWVEGLKPNTTYQYRVFVKGEPWAEEERRDWVVLNSKQGMFLDKGALAVRTKGVRFVITTGDHIYGNGMFHSHDTGNEDSDWFFTHYQPYRYILNRVAFYPACGNHDADETEKRDDYTQLLDNFYIRERFLSGNRDEGDAVNDHGLFYRFRFGKDVELQSIDSSRPDKSGPRAFALPVNAAALADFFPAVAGAPTTWRIPFFHHPPYVDGPTKSNDADAQARLVRPFLEPGGVRLVFNGHEHNFQVARHNGIHYVLTGAAGEAREEPLGGDPEAHNIAWSPRHHFLIVEYTTDGRMRVTPYGALKDGQLEAVAVTSPGGQPFPLPLEISSSAG